MLNLSLEALNECEYESSMSTQELMYSIIKMNEQSDQCYMAYNRLHDLETAYENLLTIRQVVNTYGYTQSIEALVGDNFSSKAELEASIEAIGDVAKKIFGAAKTALAASKAFYASMFSNLNEMSLKLIHRANEIKKAGNFKIDDIAIPKEGIVGEAIEFLVKNGDTILKYLSMLLQKIKSSMLSYQDAVAFITKNIQSAPPIIRMAVSGVIHDRESQKFYNESKAAAENSLSMGQDLLKNLSNSEFITTNSTPVVTQLLAGLAMGMKKISKINKEMGSFAEQVQGDYKRDITGEESHVRSWMRDREDLQDAKKRDNQTKRSNEGKRSFKGDGRKLGYSVAFKIYEVFSKMFQAFVKKLLGLSSYLLSAIKPSKVTE